MKKGHCTVSVAAIYKDASEQSMMISQLLFGETFIVREQKNGFTNILADFDDFEGWVSDLQWAETIDTTEKMSIRKPFEFHNDVLVSLGSEVENVSEIGVSNREHIKETALDFLHVPYLKGGRSFFGTETSSFVQLVFKANGVHLPRSASQQAEKGNLLAFVEESEAGDLAFFDDADGIISHVGIMLNNYQIIHCYGKVRIDAIDSSGIYNNELGRHTHKLRFVKNFLSN